MPHTPFDDPEKNPATPLDIVRQKSLALDAEASRKEEKDTKSKTAGSKFQMVLLVFYWLFFVALYDRYFNWPPEWLSLGPLALITIAAIMASAATWRAMGAHARNLIRLILHHWIISIIVAINLVAVATKWTPYLGCKADDTNVGQSLKGASSGKNWEILAENGAYKMLTLPEAKTACTQLGSSWSLPQVEEFYMLKPRPQEHHAHDFWASDFEKEGKGFAARMTGSRGFKSISYRKPTHKKLPVLCIGSVRN